MKLLLRTCIALLMIFPVASADAEPWPGWRGPRGDGSSLESTPPTDWDGTTGKNIVWTKDLPGTGHGSPIVWNDKIFLVTCLEDQQDRQLLCLSTATGETLWESTVFNAPLETKHSLNSFASSTPVTDGDQVVAVFLEVDGSEAPAKNVGRARNLTPGKIVVAAYDLSGKQRWLARPGVFRSVHGFCSNPVLHDDLVIINGDHDGDSFLVALDRKTGQTVWKVPRRHQTRSYATPLIREVEGADQLVLPGSLAVTSFNPRDGATLWTVEGPTEQFVASPVYDGKHFFVTAGYPTHHVIAIRPDGRDDVSDSHVSWHSTDVRSYVPSPILAGPFLIVADDRGTANCYDTATGERFWNVRLGRKFSASPVVAAGKVFLLAEDGTMHIVQPGKEFQQIAEPQLGERAFASPAIADGRIYIRGEQRLFAIGEK
ncbi:outer membrane biogenesis protein BamB [Rosistilla carotiformis]|uniref:Outer membrane biogenesis protein BamB n=1 Tax=Rosistilla carotiformis TaxID=2528017 RepID=A0A518JX38_9BACT|nr:PQQ-binding-like beta-propeller repeat protein [Rosistilla carotiformis]QDV70101.1 outer membrane biogenesis protein BamB [Rosistilla carotiformis]